MIGTSKLKTSNFLGFIAMLTALSTVTLPAKAITFTYGGANDNNDSSITKKVNGLTLTLDDPLDYNGQAVVNGQDVVFKAGAAADGLKFSSTGLPYSFNLTFNQPIRLVSYDITPKTDEDSDGNYFKLSQGSTISDNNSVATVGTELPFSNTTDIFLANVPILFESGDLLITPPDTPDDTEFFIDNITVSVAAVPFEFSPSLGLLAVGGIWGLSRLRKNLMLN
ncbi:MAG: hypothetical protein AB4368_23865 [Xenococcaceae cyanobacterium]